MHGEQPLHIGLLQAIRASLRLVYAKSSADIMASSLDVELHFDQIQALDRASLTLMSMGIYGKLSILHKTTHIPCLIPSSKNIITFTQDPPTNLEQNPKQASWP